MKQTTMQVMTCKIALVITTTDVVHFSRNILNMINNNWKLSFYENKKKHFKISSEFQTINMMAYLTF